ncbi:hypothetical protein [Bordetella bronchiseptica]|uniref:hypothetical protein n=1 Tax=Bordetella bronchiseptica TaxID=518 RepID=UPI000461CF8E|nr:hypothetical protein [Bordetella bronchiseptica]KDD18598.1 hypothetical protein L522_4187 [Bordetella bronchiseptica MBORD707]
MNPRHITRAASARQPQRVRNLGAFVKSVLGSRSAYAINTHQLRAAFARATGYEA